MKILHFFPWTSWGTLGGTEKYISEIAKYQSIEHNVFVAYPMLKGRGITVINNGNFKEIQLSDLNPKSSKLIGYGIVPPKPIKEWKNILKIEKFDVIHFHCYEPYLLWYFIVAKKNKIKVVFTSHIVNFTCINGNLINNLTKTLCDGKLIVNRCVNCVIKGQNKISKFKYLKQFINIFLKKINLIILEYYIDKVIAINKNYKSVLVLNGFSEKSVSLVQPLLLKRDSLKIRDIKSKKSTINIVYVGRISKLKGLDILIHAFNQLNDKSFKLDIYGPAADLNINEYLNENIHYKGVFSFDEIDTVLKNYDALCLPSISYEMAPL